MISGGRRSRHGRVSPISGPDDRAGVRGVRREPGEPERVEHRARALAGRAGAYRPHHPERTVVYGLFEERFERKESSCNSRPSTRDSWKRSSADEQVKSRLDPFEE